MRSRTTFATRPPWRKRRQHGTTCISWSSAPARLAGILAGVWLRPGRDVTFLVHPHRAAQLQATGLNIVSPHGDVTLRPKLVTADAIAAPYECRAASGQSLFARCRDRRFCRRGRPAHGNYSDAERYAHIDILAKRFGEETVAGGVCKVAATIDPEGRIHSSSPPFRNSLTAKVMDRSHRGWRSLMPSCRAPVLRLGCLAQSETRCGKNGQCSPRSVRSPARCAAISARSWPHRAARRLFSGILDQVVRIVRRLPGRGRDRLRTRYCRSRSQARYADPGLMGRHQQCR